MHHAECPHAARAGMHKSPSLKRLTVFAGLVSLIWFLVRVIPKPSRASYPCQRAAAPLASGFVIWLVGLDFQKFSETRYCGTGAAVIQTDDQMLLAQQCIANLRRILLEARKVHSRQDYARMAEPILLEVQQREQEILEYLSRDMEQPLAS